MADRLEGKAHVWVMSFNDAPVAVFLTEAEANQAANSAEGTVKRAALHMKTGWSLTINKKPEKKSAAADEDSEEELLDDDEIQVAAQKAPVKKAAPKKAAAKKASGKKAPAKKTPAKKSAKRGTPADEGDDESDEASDDPVPAAKRAKKSKAHDKDLPPGVDGALDGYTIGMAGTCNLTHLKMKSAILKYGGKYTEQMAKADFVVLGKNAGPKKLKELKENGVRTIADSEILAFFRGEVPDGKTHAADHPELTEETEEEEEEEEEED